MLSVSPFERFGCYKFSPALFRNLTPEVSDLLRQTSQLLGKMANIFSDRGSLFNPITNGNGNSWSCPPLGAPSFGDRCHPTGSLRTEGNTVTTAGGYRITQEGQFNWRITGPDGKDTYIHGDPHVAEGDGGKWDFKNNSTFVLGDGTRINVTTAPWSGNSNMTVTQKLEIISGNDRVEVTGIDQGMGKVGTVTQDGYAHANCFAGKDVFVMGRETDDWSKEGREIIGSENGGETFKLGGQLAPPDRFRNPDEFARKLLDAILTRGAAALVRPSLFERTNPFNGIRGGGCDRQPGPANDRQALGQMLRMMSRMLRMMSRMLDLNDYIIQRRSPYQLEGALA